VFDTTEQKQKKQQNEESGEKKAAKPKLIIASKLALSDGVSQIKAMIPENCFTKLVSIPIGEWNVIKTFCSDLFFKICFQKIQK